MGLPGHFCYSDVDDALSVNVISQNTTDERGWHDADADAIRLMLSSVHGGAFARAVDLGAGKGRLLHVLAPLAEQLIGIEPDRDRARFAAREAASLRSHGIQIAQGTVACIAPESIDLVLLSYVLQHMPTAAQKRLLVDADSRLREHGLLLVLIPTAAARRHLVASAPRLGDTEAREVSVDEFDAAAEGHQELRVCHFSEGDLVALFAEAGLECIRSLQVRTFEFLQVRTFEFRVRGRDGVAASTAAVCMPGSTGSTTPAGATSKIGYISPLQYEHHLARQADQTAPKAA